MSQPRQRGSPRGSRARKPNVSGLRNQGREPEPTEESIIADHPFSSDDDQDEESMWDPHAGTKPSPLDSQASDGELDYESDLAEDDETKLRDALVALVEELGDNDPWDEDWLPPRAQKAREHKKPAGEPRKSHYHGPVMANKSSCTRRRPEHRRAWRNQTDLTAYGFSLSAASSVDGGSSRSASLSVPSVLSTRASSIVPSSRLPSRAPSVAPSMPTHATSERSRKRARERSLSESAGSDLVEVEGEGGPTRLPDASLEDCQAELDEEGMTDTLLDASGMEPRAKEDIRGWHELREQIKADLAKTKKRHATLTEINQLLILHNFATLRLKGFQWIPASQEIACQWHEGEGVHLARRVRMLARHYQLFEQLPVEKRGGDWGHSLLNDERVQTAARQYLTSLQAGEVTPKIFCCALNEEIFPTLGYRLKSGLSNRTARRWLVKLGWRCMGLKKGVYMDGHERPDVRRYQDEEFLPKMALYERHMVQWVVEGDGSEMVQKDPQLGEYKANVWLRVGEQKLMKKGRGRIIHVSDFVEEENGRLIIHDEAGQIVKDARHIIYPGTNGDPWWEHTQLLAQVDNAIDIFEEAHPNCTALFIFDQSSAHASLGPDTLRAFDMNKSNGGKQRKQKDTIIPMNNPVAEPRGKVQKMTTENGEAKGLKQTLEEQGFNVAGMKAKCSPVCPFENDNCCMARLLSKQDDFHYQESLLEHKIKARSHLCIFLPKFHCELNPIEMYWGWCKYRYHEVYKAKFEDAKRVALECLNACPVEVIQRFFNRSWRFMDAYRKGLTGKAAEWAVRKQKSHRRVAQSAMMSIEALLS
ncbi:hypothetical protein DAEQUDRAFT_745617 [Daedalea quercina L-15889]|uniref:Tc1-like transposase DDE domain-containing protein n=1 Tax=Daedalea quercina L-15889 TaxID=1314783 RepID=A0A165PXA8_9APHY|nr:hypothetical protein DAEQUDRAFT_745617 [Daedalea quercina L-15889]